MLSFFISVKSLFVCHFECYPRVKDNVSNFHGLNTVNFLHWCVEIFGTFLYVLFLTAIGGLFVELILKSRIIFICGEVFGWHYSTFRLFFFIDNGFYNHTTYKLSSTRG